MLRGELAVRVHLHYRSGATLRVATCMPREPTFFFFFRSVLTSNRPQTTWFCPSAATQLRAGLRLPIGCTTIQPVPRNESRAVPWRGRGLLHPSQVRRTTSAHVLTAREPRISAGKLTLFRCSSCAPCYSLALARCWFPTWYSIPVCAPYRPPTVCTTPSLTFPSPVMPSPRAVSLPCHCSSSDSPDSDSLYSRAARPGALLDPRYPVCAENLLRPAHPPFPKHF